jgi:hypothetical protein
VNKASARLFRLERREAGRAPNMGIIMPDLGMNVKDELRRREPTPPVRSKQQ